MSHIQDSAREGASPPAMHQRGIPPHLEEMSAGSDAAQPTGHDDHGQEADRAHDGAVTPGDAIAHNADSSELISVALPMPGDINVRGGATTRSATPLNLGDAIAGNTEPDGNGQGWSTVRRKNSHLSHPLSAGPNIVDDNSVSMDNNMFSSLDVETTGDKKQRRNALAPVDLAGQSFWVGSNENTTESHQFEQEQPTEGERPSVRFKINNSSNSDNIERALGSPTDPSTGTPRHRSFATPAASPAPQSASARVIFHRPTVKDVPVAGDASNKAEQTLPSSSKGKAPDIRNYGAMPMNAELSNGEIDVNAQREALEKFNKTHQAWNSTPNPGHNSELAASRAENVNLQNEMTELRNLVTRLSMQNNAEPVSHQTHKANAERASTPLTSISRAALVAKTAGVTGEYAGPGSRCRSRQRLQTIPPALSLSVQIGYVGGHSNKCSCWAYGSPCRYPPQRQTIGCWRLVG